MSGKIDTTVFKDQVRVPRPVTDYIGEEHGLPYRRERPAITGSDGAYRDKSGEASKFKYAIVWTPCIFNDGFYLPPFIAINDVSSTVLIDAKTHTRIAQRDYDMTYEVENAMSYIKVFSACNPHEFFRDARTLGVKECGSHSLEISMTQRQIEILEDMYEGGVKFVRIKDDHWADPLWLGYESLAIAEVALQRNYLERL